MLACASLLLSPGALAQQMAPDALVKSVTDEVLDIIRKDKDIKAGSTRRAIELVEQKVLPHFSFTRMTALAVGKDWRQATPEQQKVLTEEYAAGRDGCHGAHADPPGGRPPADRPG